MQFIDGTAAGSFANDHTAASLTPRIVAIHKFQFHGSVHHISVNENTNLMQQS